jgi:hypothetical protein
MNPYVNFALVRIMVAMAVALIKEEVMVITLIIIPITILIIIRMAMISPILNIMSIINSNMATIVTTNRQRIAVLEQQLVAAYAFYARFVLDDST